MSCVCVLSTTLSSNSVAKAQESSCSSWCCKDKAAWAAGGMKVTRTPTGKPPLAGQRGAPSSAGHLLWLASFSALLSCPYPPPSTPQYLCHNPCDACMSLPPAIAVGHLDWLQALLLHWVCTLQDFGQRAGCSHCIAFKLLCDCKMLSNETAALHSLLLHCYCDK